MVRVVSITPEWCNCCDGIDGSQLIEFDCGEPVIGRHWDTEGPLEIQPGDLLPGPFELFVWDYDHGDGEPSQPVIRLPDHVWNDVVIERVETFQTRIEAVDDPYEVWTPLPDDSDWEEHTLDNAAYLVVRPSA